MQKETLIAIVIGLILGLFVTYGLYQFKQSLTTPPTTEIAVDQETTKEEAVMAELMITSPEDGLIQTENELIVSGTATEPNSYVVVFVGNEDTILQTDDAGNFSTTVDLDDGANVVTIVNINQDGELTTEERVVAVTSLFTEKNTGNETNNENGATKNAEKPEAELKTTDETDSETDSKPSLDNQDTEEATTQAILDRINKNLSNKQQEELAKTIGQLAVKRKALIGQVERVTAEALTVTTTKGTVILPIDEDVNIEKAGKELKVDEVAVDNWVLVMGMTDNTTVKPEQILVSSESLRPKPHFVMIGTILDIGNSTLSIVSRNDSNEYQLKFDKNTDYQDLDGQSAKLADFSKDLTVLAVGYENTVKEETEKLLTTMRALAAFTE